MSRLALVVPLLVAATAFAQDLKPGQEEAKARFAKDVQTNLDWLNEACGTTFKDVQSDFQHYDASKFTSMHPGQVCQGMLLGVKMACSKPAYRKAVQARVKALACVFSGVKQQPSDRQQSREKANLALENGVFTYHLDAAHAGTAIAAQQVLEAALDR